jgi:hypothetical protein
MLLNLNGGLKAKGEKRFDKLFNVKYLPLFHHFKAIYQFPKHIIFLVKIVANATLMLLPCHSTTTSGLTDVNKDAHDVFEDLTKARRCNPKSLMCGYLIINSLRHKHEYIRDLLQRWLNDRGVCRIVIKSVQQCIISYFL